MTDKDKIVRDGQLPSETKYPTQPAKPDVDPVIPAPRLPAGAPEEVPGIHNDRIPLPPDEYVQTPNPAPGKPL